MLHPRQFALGKLSMFRRGTLGSLLWGLAFACCLSVAGCSKRSQPTANTGGSEAASESASAESTASGDAGRSSAEANASSKGDANNDERQSEAGDDDEGLNEVADNSANQQSTDDGERDATNSSSMMQSANASQVNVAEEMLKGTFTTQRLIALTPKGPTLVDLLVSVDGLSLDEATEQITQSIADEVFAELEEPVEWDTLLEQPLVQSGWLGNLIAEEDQVEQLISMYDTERDNIVTEDEFAPFLSRGLARNRPLQISDIGNAPDASISRSPWGDADRNQDYALDEEERSSIHESIVKYDYNGDAIVAMQELNQARGMQMQQQGSNSTLLETSTLVIAEGVDAEDEQEAKQAIRRISRSVLEHYTFLEGIPRQEWTAWSDARWKALDENEDGILVRAELEKLISMDADTRLVVRFPNLEEAEAEVVVWSDGLDDDHRWNASNRGGRLQSGGAIAEIQIDDGFSKEGRQVLRTQLEAALTNAQLQAFFTNQLQLSEDAFVLLDSDEDETLSSEEFNRVWRWLSARQGTRLMARWMTTGTPWFQLIDANGDQRLTELEIDQVDTFLAGLDQNKDAELTPDELPLLVRLEIQRTDSRLNQGNFGFPTPDAEQVDADWFSAMDTNRDSFISRTEFLGEIDDFGTLDANKDGFLGRSEVYGAFDSN